MANESYDDFVSQLQKEIEDDEGIKFGVVEKHSFANIVVETKEGKAVYLGADSSEKLWEHLLKNDYIDKRGKVQDSLRTDIKNNTVNLPDELNEQVEQITRTLKKVAGSLNIKNAADKENVTLNKAVYLAHLRDLYSQFPIISMS